ncbi:MAG: hypothetical protein WDO19_14425 [Bacteroidota bacterium]
MQFDDFDKKIKEAAERHHPAYEEKAWDKMEKLLDKHLPNEKKDKRKFFLLWFLLLLTGAGIYFAIAKPNNRHKSTANEALNADKHQKSTANERQKSTADEPLNITTNKSKNNNANERQNANADKLQYNNANKHQYANADELPNIIINKSKNDNANKHQYANADKSQYANANRRQNTTTVIKAIPQDINNDNIVNTSKAGLDNTSTSANTNIPGSAITSNPDSALSKKTDSVAKIEDEEKNLVPRKKEKQKPGRQKKTSFAITFTAGPDLSTVGLSEIGKVKLSYGAGLSYSLNRFTLRSGFYVSKKVYSAGPNEYHPPEHYWTYYVDLDKVDADCKLYEIPVTVSYNFSQTKSHNWFASAGLSTFLMKRETYDYYYKNPGTQVPYNRSWTLENGSNHFFSIINLSAGYERKVEQ